MPRLNRITRGLLVASLSLVVTSAWCGESPLGKKIDNFTLRDYRGKEVSLSDFSDSQLVAVVFLGVECPLAKLYAPRLEELRQEFAERKVTFLGIDANQQDALTELAAFARVNNLSFPLLKDTGNEIADRFSAHRTPEVFLLDRNREIRYRGRIDDQYGLGSSSGYARSKVSRRDLATAIEELLAGKPVSQSEIEATGCLIGRANKVASKGTITYGEHIAKILQDRCVSCHRSGEIGPFPLNDYDEIVGWSGTLREVLAQKRMPPWFANPAFGHFTNDSDMPESEREQFLAWIDDGCPKGDLNKLPAPRKFVDGWQIGVPDQIVHMAETPYDVQAEGVVDYLNFTVDPGWKEDKWIKAIEVRPDNRQVVHHVILYARGPSDANGGGRSRNANIGGYVPGSGSRVYPDGVAIHVPAGSQLVFQMHYTPNGRPQKDNTFAGFIFVDKQTVKRRATTSMVANNGFTIPPGDGNHEVKATMKMNKDMRLLWLAPHMHVRGKDYRYEAEYPDGTREVLLDVPRYDFNWQVRYLLNEPKLLPAGTVLHSTAHFDNSDANLANPDPADTVKYGPQTWHEMMNGWFAAMPDAEDVEADATLEKATEEDAPFTNTSSRRAGQ